MEVRKWIQGLPFQESGSEQKRKKAMKEDKKIIGLKEGGFIFR